MLKLPYIVVVFFLLNRYGLVFSQIPSSGLVSYYPFSGNTIDSSLNGNDGQLFGPIPVSDRFARPESAYFFDGVDDSMIIPVPATITNDFTLSFWEKSDRLGTMNLIRFGETCQDTLPPQGITLNYFYNIYTYGLTVTWQECSPNKIAEGLTGQYTTLPEFYNNSVWHHFVLVKKDTVITFVVDNIPIDTVYSQEEIFSSPNLQIGGSGKYVFYGKLDDLCLYNRALDSAEISMLYYENNLWLNYGNYEDWISGSTYEISWGHHPDLNTLKIEYSLNNGGEWALLDIVPAVNLRHYWTIPDTVSSNCLIKISDFYNSSLYRISEPFSISEYRWDLMNDNAKFLPRDGASPIVYENIMWLMGGWNPLYPDKYPFGTNNEIWISTDGKNWDFAGNAPWAPRHEHRLVVHLNKIWVLGGDNNFGYYQNDIWSTDNGIAWNLNIKNAPWSKRVTPYVVQYKEKIWLMGGQEIILYGFEKDTVYNDVWVSEDGLNWTQVISHAPWEPRAMIGGKAVFQDKIWLMGGGTYNEPREYYNDVWVSEDGINWTELIAGAPWHPRQYHNVAVFDNKIWIMAGWDGFNNRKDVWYSSDGINWKELKGTSWPGRHAASVFVYKDALFMVAGNLWNDSWRLVNIKSYYPEPPDPDSDLFHNFLLYPNPFEEEFIIDLEGKDPGSKINLKIYNLTGQIIYDEEYIVTTSKIYLQPGRINPGLYLITIDDGKKKITRKLIKSK